MTSFGAVIDADNVAGLECERRRSLFGPYAFGTLGPALDRFASVRGPAGSTITPESIALAVFAGDHGIAYADTSAYQPDVTLERATNLAAGRGPIAQLAAAAQVHVRTYDIALRTAPTNSAIDSQYRVRSACGRIDMQDALSEQHLTAAFDAGITIANNLIDSGHDLLIGAVCGVGVSTAADTMVCLVTGIEPVIATTRGSGINDTGWIKKCTAVRNARYRAREHRRNSRALLRTVGGADLATLTAFIAQAAHRRTPVLVDDIPSLICAVLAQRLAPGTRQYVIPANTSPHPTGERLRQRLAAPPLLDQNINLGSGAGALTAIPQLRAACALIDNASELGLPQTHSTSAAADWNTALI